MQFVFQSTKSLSNRHVYQILIHKILWIYKASTLRQTQLCILVNMAKGKSEVLPILNKAPCYEDVWGSGGVALFVS
jgi:hypothetical protein